MVTSVPRERGAVANVMHGAEGLCGVEVKLHERVVLNAHSATCAIVFVLVETLLVAVRLLFD